MPPVVGYGGAMSTIENLVWFVAAPLTLLGIIALAVFAGSWVKSPKYRPGLSWWAEPVWIAGGDAADVVAAAPVTEGRICRARW